jgi:propionyl-CoA:succinyl-CoA transferase
VLIELNRRQPAALMGMHDIFEPEDPPTRRELPIYHVRDRVGSPVVIVSPSKIVGVVMTDMNDECGAFCGTNPVTERIGHHVAEFLVAELRAGRIPGRFLPLQSGVGDIANSVLESLGAHPEIPAFEMYTEVLQDSVLSLLDHDRCHFASTCALTLSSQMSERFRRNLEFYRSRIILRPQEISNHPEIVRRLGIISMNTAIEVDLFGNVNSTHVMGRQIMNGIGGSGDFTRNAYLSIFSCPSTQKDGRISTIVPLVTHVDHSEHSVQVVVTENGVADLRGRDPQERARLLIKNCAHPEYRDQLLSYLEFVEKGHTPQSLSLSFAMHRNFAETGDMRHVKWSEWRSHAPVLQTQP